MRNEDIMRLLGAVGGGVTLFEAILALSESRLSSSTIVSSIISIILAVIILISVIKPDNPIPLHWLIFVSIGIILIVYSSLVGGILVLIGGFVGYTERYP